MNRRNWLRKSILASSAVVLAGQSSLLASDCAPSEVMQDEYLLLNSNENPYGPSPEALKAIQDALVAANRYPFPQLGVLKEKIATKENLTADNILITAGSTEILSLMGQYAGLEKGAILTPDLSFPTITRFGAAHGASIQPVGMNGYDIDLNRLLENITDKTKVVYVCNPNNPTGTEVNVNDLKAFCRKVPSHLIICVDEAYLEYTKLGRKSSVVDLIADLPNLVVCRTFSKAYGLAGLRIGYALGDEELINTLSRRHLGWQFSTSIASLAGATATLNDDDFIQKCVNKNEEGRQIVYEAFDEWDVKYAPSATNFVYASKAQFQEDIRGLLREKKVLVSEWGSMEGHFRISISKPDEMRKFVEIAKGMLK